jgi:hypothetical protein
LLTICGFIAQNFVHFFGLVASSQVAAETVFKGVVCYELSALVPRFFALFSCLPFTDTEKGIARSEKLQLD